jgi:hypothetical protein
MAPRKRVKHSITTEYHGSGGCAHSDKPSGRK